MMSKPKPLKRKCKHCGNRFETLSFNVWWCCPECGLQLALKAAARQYMRATTKQKQDERKKTEARKERLKTRQDWLKDAQTIFNKFIRLRDKNEPCISCGRHHQGQYHAGHYRSVGAAPELRFCEINVHKQCAPCNNHKSGNIIEYRINLVKKIGVDKVEFLERQDHPPAKMSIDEIKSVIKHYKEKVKALEA